MAKIVTITNPLTGQPAQVDQLDHTAQQIDDGLNIARGVSNPNLLDNWYFCNPINQRGQTSYTGAGYGIDRWKIEAQYNGDAITIKDNGIEVVCGGTAAFHRLVQIIDNPEQFRGKTLTWTVKIVSVSNEANRCGALGYFVNGVEQKYMRFYSPGVYSFSFTVPDYTTELFIHFGAYRNCSFVCDAVKLELGTTQTLAHQDENGNWVLNEIPDYGEQLARCQRYHVKGRLSRVPTLIYGSGKELWFSIKLPVPMRAAIPALVKITTYAWIYHQGTAFDANGAQEFLPGESTNYITTDTDCTHSGEIGVHLTLDNALTNAVDGSTGWIAYIDYELTENL